MSNPVAPPTAPSATAVTPPAGRMVTPAGSAHSPTVSQGHALVLYLLPQGRIEFTKPA